MLNHFTFNMIHVHENEWAGVCVWSLQFILFNHPSVSLMVEECAGFVWPQDEEDPTMTLHLPMVYQYAIKDSVCVYVSVCTTASHVTV